MGLFDNFPYTNFHELNLDWILKMLQQIDKTMSEFVAINALKYADPIQWNITSQYEKNTIVIDPQTGTAYISVQPVPMGVALTNTDYWTVVFDLGSFVVRAAQNFSDHWESETTLTATFPSAVGDWLVWNDTLYIVISPITAGDQYVINSNIEHWTVENIVGHLTDLYTTRKDSIVGAINSFVVDVNNTTGDLNNLTTTDKSNLVAAINEVLTILVNTAGDLNNLTTTDKSNLVAAINEVLSDLGSESTQRTNADAALSSEISKREFNWYNRHFLFLGDSYGDEANEWADLLINYTGLSERAYNLCVGGAGFYNPNPIYQFQTQLENFVNNHTADEIAAITDIVICGGLNDSISSSPLGYSDVTTAMGAFNTYLRAHFNWARVSLGFIGNGNDYDPDSLIGTRTYAARQCCRYTYYNTAALYNWEILHNVEYALTSNAANIDTDGVHPTAAGSVEIFRAIAEALINGSADYNYPIYPMGLAGVIGTLTGNISYKIHNNLASLMSRTLVFTVGAGAQLTSGTSVQLATFSNLGFNEAINFTGVARLYAPEIDGVATTNNTYVNVRLTILHNSLYMTVLEADGTTMHTYTWTSAGNIVIEDFDINFDSMILI